MNKLERLRAEAVEWVSAHFPAELAGCAPAMGEAEPIENPVYLAWHEALCERGWATPTWPIAYGGAGLDAAEADVVRETLRRAGAWNPIGWGMAVRMFGPTLMEFGTEDQKRTHLVPIARGETRWCQGFSEPGAGSDLAALQTSAIDAGDHFLVNGQKIWTSGADKSDWCFALVRTDRSRKQGGISFLMIDMRSPGVTVKPIALISGSSAFCETFFTDVRVPKENLVGRLNEGWTVGKRLLQFERVRNPDAPVRRAAAQPLAVIVDRYVGRDAEGRVADPDLRRRIIALEARQRAFDLTVARAQEQDGKAGPGTTTSILKNVASTLTQERAELVIEAMGAQGLGWAGEGFTSTELATTRAWLAGKETTIYGGSYEIQNNIIAKRILGLPDQQ